MSAALITVDPAPRALLGPGSRRRAENDRWRGRGAAARWLAQHRVAQRGDVDITRATTIEKNNEYRARHRGAARKIGGDRSGDEVDIAAPGATAAPVVDFARLRVEHPDRWSLLLLHLQGCRAARRVADALADGVPAVDIHRLVGTSKRAVNYARQTLRNRLAMMAAGEPPPKSRKRRPANDLWEAAGICAPAAGAPARSKSKRKRSKDTCTQLSFFDLAAMAERS